MILRESDVLAKVAGERVPMEVEEGDEVVFSKYGGTEIRVDRDDVLRAEPRTAKTDWPPSRFPNPRRTSWSTRQTQRCPTDPAGRPLLPADVSIVPRTPTVARRVAQALGIA
jgi:Chaperonin 10 Kd subunit